MKVLVIAPELFATEGGISRIMRLYVRALAEHAGQNSIWILAFKDNRQDLERAKVLAGDRLRGVYGSRCSKLRFALAALWHGISCDRIVCGHVHQLILARFAKLFRPSLKYYVVAHGIEVWRPYSPLERFALRGAERIFCVSEYTRRQMLRFDAALVPARLVVLPNTFDPRFSGDEPPPGGYIRVAAAAHRPPSAASQLAESTRPRILVVSRLDSGDPYKGVDVMIEAMPCILRYYPHAQLRIVGGGTDRPRLERLAGSVNVGKGIHFAGIVDDQTLAGEYHSCDIFALPSRKEGFGLVFLEAMGYGKPCLAARAGGVPEVVDDEVGALVEYGDVDQIAVAVADLMRHPRDPNAIRRRAESFAFPIFKLRLTELFNDTPASGQRHGAVGSIRES